MEIQNSKDWAKVYRACNFIEKGVCEYADERVYLSEETLAKSLHTIKGRPVIIDHVTGITPDNMNDHAVGYVVDYEMQSACDCKFVIFDDEGKQVIADGYSVSCAYKPKSFGPGGTWHNVPYDREITDLEYTHLALVQNPRYEDAKVYENAKDSDGRWITIKGTHVFVKDGQSVEDAMKEHGFGKSSSTASKKKSDNKSQTRWVKVGRTYMPIDKDEFRPSSSTTKKKDDDELVTVEKADPAAIKKEKEAKDRWDKTMKEYGELSGKYAKEDADFDIDQMKKDIKTVQSKGYESVEDIAEFLGLDEDEVRETIGEGDRSGSSFDEEGWKKFVEDNKKKEDVSHIGRANFNNTRFTFNEDKESMGLARPIYQDLEKAKDLYEMKSAGQRRAEEENLKRSGKRGIPLRDMPVVVKGPTGGYIVATVGLAQKYELEEVYPISSEKHNGTEEQLKEEDMKVDEFFNKMGEMIEEKLNACKSKMNEGEEQDKEDDDKIELDGEVYSKKELVNAFKEKKNAEEQSKEKSDEQSEEESQEESEEKQNSGDEFFNAMEKRMQQQADANDKIEVYSQQKGLEKGKSIYGG